MSSRTPSHNPEAMTDKRENEKTGQLLTEQLVKRDALARQAIVQIQQEIAVVDRDLFGVMTLMAERALALTGATGADVELVEGDWMICRAIAGTAVQQIGQSLGRHHSLSGIALESGTTLVCDDAETDTRVNRDMCRAIGARSLIAAPLRVGNQLIGALKVTSSKVNAFTARDAGNLQLLVETLGVTIEHRRLAEQQRRSVDQYRLLFDNNPQPMWVSEYQTRRFLAVNAAMLAQYGYTQSECLAMSARQLWVEDEAEAGRALKDIPHPSVLHGFQEKHRRKDGSIIDVQVSANAIDFDGKVARLVLCVDITERLRAERELARVSRAQRLLSACNEALIRAKSEQALLGDICKITVDIGGYSMTWVGFAQNDADKSIAPVARAGLNTGYLDDLKMTWADGVLEGQGPAGQTIRSGKLMIVEDVSLDPSFRPWADKAKGSGFRSVVCLPLANRAGTYGLFYLYALEIARISTDEIQLLQQLAADLAFGIDNLRAQEEQRRVQAVMLKVAVAVSATAGDEFFEQLASHMTEALGAQGGMVSRLLSGTPASARCIAAVVDGERRPDFNFELKGTPCEAALEGGNIVLPAQVQQRFPASPLMLAVGAQACVARSLVNTSGDVIGFIVAYFRQPISETDFIVSTLQIFAARAAAEMERQTADVQIRHQASLLDKAQDAIIVRTLDHRVIYWNKSAERVYGWTAAQVMGRSLVSDLYTNTDAFQVAQKTVMERGEWTGEILQHRSDGGIVTIEGRWTLVRDDNDQPHSILAINTDVTRRKSAEQEIQKLAYFDPLTQLPNRLMLTDRLQHALSNSSRTHTGGALMFIDLDNFKTLNDTLGHDMGDLLLQNVAQRLSENVRQSDLVARLGGDEFVVLIENLAHDGVHAADGAMVARAIGEKVLSALQAPYLIAGNEHQSTASIGIAPFMDQSTSVGDLLKQADIAMYQAKAAGRNTLRFFDPDLQAAVTARAALETDLRQALLQHQFLLHYQPQLNNQGVVTGAEALARWQHLQRGPVSPKEFITLAEETGLILPLGRWVLTEACRLLADWAGNSSNEHLTLSVNVSARQFRHPDFVANVLSTLAETGANPRRLKLELTESLLLDDIESTIEKMTCLKNHGVGFSLDDFGTGYSSLSYLKRLPLDQLKIDQSFVRDVLTDPNDAAIARTIIALGQSLGLTVIAEGVETQDQCDILTSHGCHAFQGYLFSRPLPRAELDAYLQSRHMK